MIRPTGEFSKAVPSIALACAIALICVQGATAQDQEVGILAMRGSQLRDVALLREGDEVRGFVWGSGPHAPRWTYRAEHVVEGAGNFNGSAVDDLIFRSGSEIALVSYVGSRWSLLMSSSLPMRIGDWDFDYRAEIRGIGDFDGPAANGVATDDLLIAGPRGLAILTLRSGRLDTLAIARSGTWLGEWNFGADHQVRGVGDFNGDGRDDILISSGWGIGFLTFASGRLTTLALARYGTRLGDWDLDPSFGIGGIGDFDGDGRDEVVLTLAPRKACPGTTVVFRPGSPALGIVGLDPALRRLRTLALARLGDRTGDWRFNSTQTVQGIGNFDDTGGDDILITDASSLGILSLRGGFLTSLMKQDWKFDAGKSTPAVANFDDRGGDDLVRRTDWDLGLMTFNRERNPTRLSWLVNTNLCHSFGNWKVRGGDQVAAVGNFDGQRGADIVVERRSWIEQGPRRITNSEGVKGMKPQCNPASGAVAAIAAHPTNPDIVYVGSVGGGVWKTENATDPSPTWIPLTDDQPSLAITSLAFDPRTCHDPTSRDAVIIAFSTTCSTLFAGTGALSHSAWSPKPEVVSKGLLKTEDGGKSWQQLGASDFAGTLIRRVVPTRLADPGHVILVATHEDVYRSTDGGQRWSKLSGTRPDGSELTDELRGLPPGRPYDLIADPGDDNRFFAAIRGAGIFRSRDGGVTWKQVIAGSGRVRTAFDTDGDGMLDPGSARVDSADWIDLAAQKDTTTGKTILYASLRDRFPPSYGVSLTAVFYSVEQTGSEPGDAWAEVDNAPRRLLDQIYNDSDSFIGDRDRSYVFYIRGRGLAYRVTINPTGIDDWTLVFADGNRPMADSRHMAFDAEGNLLESDDGGIYRLENPRADEKRSATNPDGWRWVSVNGNLGITEFSYVSYDALNNIVFGGSWDNGGVVQLEPSGSTWYQIFGGDGGFAAVENDLRRGVSNHYQQGNNLRYERDSFDRLNRKTQDGSMGLRIGPPGTDVRSLESHGLPFAVNAVQPNRILMGSRFLYESQNRGDDLTVITATVENRPRGNEEISALAFGSADNADAALFGTTEGRLWFRESLDGPIPFRESTIDVDGDGSRDPRGSILDVVLDPSNHEIAYVMAQMRRRDTEVDIYRTADGGEHWTPITGNLNALTSGLGNDLRTLAIAPAGSRSRIVWAGGNGGVFATVDNVDELATSRVTLDPPSPPFPIPIWEPFGRGLPNALVNDLVYDPTDRLLIAGTVGRGAWSISAPCPGDLQ